MAREKKSAKPPSRRRNSPADARTLSADEPATTAAAYLHPEGELSVLSVSAKTPEFRLTARRRKVVQEASKAIRAMLQQGYTILVADTAGVYTRVRQFDEQTTTYRIAAANGEELVIPIVRARAVALPRHAGG